MAVYDYEIGADAASRQNVEDLGVNPPRGQFSDYSVQRTGGDGVEVGDGFPNAEWRFDFLTRAMFNTLMSYLTAGQASGQVSIKTRKTDGTYQAYATAIMHRPDVPKEAAPVFTGWRSVKIQFSRLEV